MNRATEIRLLAERQMGEFLKAMPKADGGDATRARSGATTEQPQRLRDIGISKDQSSRAQQIADIPAEEFAERIAVAKASGGKLSTASVLESPRHTAESVGAGGQ